MRNAFYKLEILLITVLFALVVPFAVAASKTYTGTVGDAMCGLKHVTTGTAECTHLCVQHGSKYALLVKEKVYTLETKDKAILNQLNDLAGQTVSLKGELKGNTIEVDSVKKK